MEELEPVPERLTGLAYPRSHLNDLTLDDNLSHFRVQPTRNHHFPTSVATLGTLDTLPVELLEIIVLHLDLQTLRWFRYVNRRASELVISFTGSMYSTIMQHVPNALPAMATIRTEKWVTLKELYEALCTYKCDLCDDFGGYLYLLTCRRACFSCLLRDQRFSPVPRTSASPYYKIGEEVLKLIPSMKNLPGRYTPRDRVKRGSPLPAHPKPAYPLANNEIRGSHMYFDWETCIRVHVSLHGLEATRSRPFIGDPRAREQVLSQLGNDPSTRPSRFSVEREDLGLNTPYPCVSIVGRYSCSLVEPEIEPSGVGASLCQM